MILAKISVSGIRAVVVDVGAIPAGIIGAKVRIEYTDPRWDGLSKTVVFRGAVTRDVLNAGELVEIPAECMEKPGVNLWVGVYGTDADGVAIPTLWADLGRVRAAADPSGDESTAPSLPVWAQLQGEIEQLKETGLPGGGGGVDFKTDETLTLKNGILSVNTTNDMEQDNTLPITSAGVFATVGNIEALLKTI